MTTMVATTTSTVLLPSLGVGSSSMDIEGSSGRVVRFESKCVLIPDTGAKGLSRSYTLPLWKKKPNQSSDSEAEPALPSSSSTDTHVVLKVPIPRFISKASRSPTRGRTSTSPPALKPLSSCLVHRSPSLSPPVPFKSMRKTSLPISTEERKHDTAMTIPLRECCADCEPVTEESFLEGEHWPEKFSKGARRRRSASLDNPGTSPQFNKSSVFSITVDEVDKRRKSVDCIGEDPKRFGQPHVSPPRVVLSRTPLQKDASLLSVSTTSSSSELSPGDFSSRPKSSPIQEEDEDQLFPLPSPRRSPSSSQTPSPAPSPKPSPSPSPNVSATSLSASHGSPSARDGVLISSISRKAQQPHDDLLSPHRPQAPVLPPLPILSGFSPVFDWASHENSRTATSTATKPRLQITTLTSPTNPPRSSVPSSLSRAHSLPNRGRGTTATTKTKPLPAVPPEYLRSSTSPPTSSSLSTSSSSTSSKSPPRSLLSIKSRKPAFPLPFFDVLKGVNSFGGVSSVSPF